MSVEEFRTALSLKDDQALAIAGLAMVDFYENRLSSCLAGLRRAVAIDNEEPDYLFDLGQAAARSEKYREAADAYEQAMLRSLRPDVFFVSTTAYVGVPATTHGKRRSAGGWMRSGGSHREARCDLPDHVCQAAPWPNR